MLIATYDYWGYYNVTFLGGEARDPGRTIPRAVLISIGMVAVLYLGLNASVLSGDGVAGDHAGGAGVWGAAGAALGVDADGVYAGAGRGGGDAAGAAGGVLVMVTAFASVFSLLLGYSRIPFAAARDGNFPAVFGGCIRRGVSVCGAAGAGGVACLFCFFSLADVIAALVVLRILLQFGLQHVGVMVLRVRGRRWCGRSGCGCIRCRRCWRCWGLGTSCVAAELSAGVDVGVGGGGGGDDGVRGSEAE
jgi:APA family basic amino acid/polyamine antiporter